MKTLIDGYNIDLREVTAIGPLRYPVNSRQLGADGFEPVRGFGCSVWLFGRSEPFWFTMSEGLVDPYLVDDSKNAYTRVLAQSNYNKFVGDWQAVS